MARSCNFDPWEFTQVILPSVLYGFIFGLHFFFSFLVSCFSGGSIKLLCENLKAI